MTATEPRHPTTVISVKFRRGEPRASFQNQDVAFVPVTRFNLRIHVKGGGRNDHLGGRHLVESADYEAYWRRRIDIFERVCVPSVLNLTPRPDAWYIAFDDVVPEYISALLDRLSMHPWIVPYFLNRRGGWNTETLTGMLTGQLTALGKHFLCSTRFDSDDSLHQQFYGVLDRAISRLREIGMLDETRCLNPTYGLAEAGGALTIYLRPHSMFESIFEPVESLNGPQRGPHDRITEKMPLVEIVTNYPMWIYHRHEANLDGPFSRFSDQLQLSNPVEHFAEFGLDPEGGSALSPNDPFLCEPSTTDRDVASEDAHQPDSGPRVHPPFGLGRTLQEFLPATGAQPDLAADLVLSAANTGPDDPLEALLQAEASLALNPGEASLRQQRDELRSRIRVDLDFQKQFEPSNHAVGFEPIPNRVLYVVQESLPYAGSVEACMLHDTVLAERQIGIDAAVVTLLPHPKEVQSDSIPLEELIDGVPYFRLSVDGQLLAGAGALATANLVALARLVREFRPSIIVPGPTGHANQAAAAIGRTFGLRVDFGRDRFSTDAPKRVGAHQQHLMTRKFTRRRSALPSAPWRERRTP